MLRCLIFLIACQLASAAAGAIFSRNFTKPYVLKKTWVQNFIKFQYIFEGKNNKAKIVPLGCVPTNTESGAVLKAGEQHNGGDFIFQCEEGEDGVLSYEAIACVDATGTLMNIGETRRLGNGTVVLHCNIFGGALKKVVERAAGCYFNETIYGEDDQWVEPVVRQSDKMRAAASKKAQDSSRGPLDALLSGRLMMCFRPHYSYYESHIIGCVIGRMGLKTDEYASLTDGTYVKCVENELGSVQLEYAKAEDLSCKIDNKTYAHNTRWTDEKRSAEMMCTFGHLQKTGCNVGGEQLPIGQEVHIDNGCVFLCHPQTNVYICDVKLGDYKIVEGPMGPEESKDKKKKKTLDDLRKLVF